MSVAFQIAAFLLHLQGLRSGDSCIVPQLELEHESGRLDSCGSVSGPNEASGYSLHVEAEYTCRNRSRRAAALPRPARTAGVARSRDPELRLTEKQIMEV